MKMTKKEELGSKLVKGEKKNVQPAFKRPFVSEQARKEMKEKYKYGDKYHD